MSAEGQRFGRTWQDAEWVALGPQDDVTGTPAERLTHAERAKVDITFRNINAALVSLDKAAAIERVAREVCEEAGKHYLPRQLGIRMGCLRALVQP
jgi:hypothetical protein